MDTEKQRRDIRNLIEMLDSTISLSLINGETRTIKIGEAKGLKQMIDKNTGNIYNRIYLRHKDEECGRKYLDVVSPCDQDLLDLLGSSLESVQLKRL